MDNVKSLRDKYKALPAGMTPEKEREAVRTIGRRIIGGNWTTVYRTVDGRSKIQYRVVDPVGPRNHQERWARANTLRDLFIGDLRQMGLQDIRVEVYPPTAGFHQLNPNIYIFTTLPDQPRRFGVEPTHRAWNDGTIQKMAQVILDSKRWLETPILADALEEAGYTNAEILTLLRTHGDPNGDRHLYDVVRDLAGKWAPTVGWGRKKPWLPRGS